MDGQELGPHRLYDYVACESLHAFCGCDRPDFCGNRQTNDGREAKGNGGGPTSVVTAKAKAAGRCRGEPTSVHGPTNAANLGELAALA